MPTILELINLTTDYLDKKGISSARINAELMLSDVLKCKRLDLYLSFDKPVGENEISLYRDYLRRRATFEPLQYILGKVEFFGYEFLVNPDVLIPRQETEILVEKIIDEIKSGQISSLLDIGTGSGIIPICVAKKYENLIIDAVDICEKALANAKNNADLLQLGNRINFERVDILNGKHDYEKKYDLIVSNPPYVSKDDYRSLQREIIDFEPSLAVTDNNDGLTFYREIIKFSKKTLNSKGMLFFEVGQGQALQVEDLLINNGFVEVVKTKDYSQIDRVVQGRLE